MEIQILWGKCLIRNELTPWRRVQRCSPVCDETFVGPMEAVLDLYSQPYDARYSVICKDEHVQPLRTDTRPPRIARSGRPATYDYAYARHGTCTVWLFASERQFLRKRQYNMTEFA